ncbi:MAG: hypothetical protein HOP28_09000 [Gemmatimonadales bacterium]|nr:hypothetical protein [Gemmatimonadales bacterium]
MAQSDAAGGKTDYDWAPRREHLVAAAVFLAAALTLCWPMLTGQVIASFGSDQFVAGHAFRSFGAEYWRQHHTIPLWNPYIFGGMPYVGGMHGDIFYPTAWVRWVLDFGPALNLTFASHLVLAGISAYAFTRALKASWAGALTAGLSYQLTGIVASLVSPGHDGKIFVYSLAPLLFLALMKGIRGRSIPAFGAAALTIGLSLHGHPQVSYYLLVAAGIWTFFLVFWSEAKPEGVERWKFLALSAAVVVLGFGIYAIQALPFAAYIPFSPRAGGGPSSGWEYATSYALPLGELWSAFYPQINGILDSYTGTNPLKHHTEHVGVVVILLAICGIGSASARRERWVLVGIGLLFLLVSLGGHTPFYRLWYELMPKMKQVRAPAMALYLVALPIAVFAGFGLERLLRGEIPVRRVLVGAGFFAAIGLFGAMGALGGVAETLAHPGRVQQVFANAEEIRAGGIRLLLFALLGGGALFAVTTKRLRGSAAVGLVLVVLVADLWSVNRRFFVFGGTAEQLFGPDELTTEMKKTPLPFRLWDPRGDYEGLSVYPGSWVMGQKIPQLFGYHGNELRNFDELWGEKNVWSRQLNLNLLKLFAVRYITFRKAQALPGYHLVKGPLTTRVGSSGILYEADTIPPYARLMSAAAKVPEEQLAQTVSDPRFPVLHAVLYPEGAEVSPAPLGDSLPPGPTATATLASWEPGRIEVTVEGSDERPLYLVVAENWYKDWRVTVDGQAAPLLRGQKTMLSAVVPPGAKRIAFEFRSAEYDRGKLISFLSLAVVAGMILFPLLRRRGAAHG